MSLIATLQLGLLTVLLDAQPAAETTERRLGDGGFSSDLVAVVLLIFAAIVFPVIFVVVILRLRKLEAQAEDEERASGRGT